MPEEDRHGAQVGADLRQVGRERVTQGVGMDVEREARALGAVAVMQRVTAPEAVRRLRGIGW